MMTKFSVFVLLSVVTLAYTSNAPYDPLAFSRIRVVHERPLHRAEGWFQRDRASPDLPIRFIIAVKQRNTDVLQDTLLKVSDPTSPFYGRHLSFEAVNKLVEPAPESIEAVERWLVSHGIDLSTVETTPNKDMYAVTTTIGVIEQLIQAPFYEHVHSSGRRVARLADGFSLPADVVDHIDTVGPTFRLPTIRNLKTKPSQPTAFGNTPQSLRTLYKVGTYVAKNSKSSVAATGFLEQYIDLDDLTAFWKDFFPFSVGEKVDIIGPNDKTNPGVEAMLDIEYVTTIGANVSSTFWYTAGRAPKNPENEPFLDFLFALGNTTNPPLVISTSYGDNENTVDLDYATRINTEFQKAGTRGISLLFSSGDGGVSGGQAGFCITFVPTFPAGSPWITSVGGTSGTPESAASLSSGGFSNYWARPDYQKSAVSTYFSVASGLPPATDYNQTGSGFPTVSAQATDFNIVVSGSGTLVDGTSCSSPTFAGVVALLNDVRLQQGKSSLGFLNPLFFANAAAFNDITSGSNPGCFTNGFPAAKGWDPVTGLGTPNFEKLAAIVSALP